jgi:hypothetical protein
MRRLWRYRVTVALMLAVAAMSTSIFLLAKQSSDNARATSALCALRANLARRGQQANDFLHEHPNGALGIPPGVIVKSIRDTRQTLRALRVLRCG